MGLGAAVAGAVLAVVAAVMAVITLVGRRRGYGFGGDTVVRCRRDHLFTTIWVPGVSFKAARLGMSRRFQHCPVGKHWSIVVPVKVEDLSEEQRQFAAAHHDVRVP